MVGDCGVGKTQIRNRYTLDEFNPESKSTIGVEFAFKTMDIDGNEVKSQIWDTSGEERYRAITSAYYRGSVGAIIVFDVTKHKSFQSMENWIAQLRQYGDENIVGCIVGNKIDLPNREVTTREASKLAETAGFLYMETSALDGTGVHKAFKLVMQRIYSIVSAKQQSRKRAIKADSITNNVVDLSSKNPEDQSSWSGGCKMCT